MCFLRDEDGAVSSSQVSEQHLLLSSPQQLWWLAGVIQSAATELLTPRSLSSK